MKALEGLFHRVSAATIAHPRITVAIALAMAAFSIFFTVRNLGFLTSQRALISPENRLVQLSKLIDRVDDLDTFAVAIENRQKSRSLQFLHALVRRLQNDRDSYLEIFYRIDPKLFRPWALLYLDKKDLRTLRDNLEDHHDFIENLAQAPGLTNFFRQVNHEMASRMVGELFTGFLDEKPAGGDKKPLDLTFLIRVLGEMKQWLDGDSRFTSPWESFFTNGSWEDDAEQGYFWTENKRYLLLFVTPKKTGKSFAKAHQSLIALRKTIAQVQADFPDIRVGVTGREALNADEMGMALHDMSLATMISLVCLALLLVVFWRGFRRPLLEMIELLVALSWTFGLTTLFIGHLNILSVTFAPLLLGLGIDYGIHWFARYQEEEQLRGASKKEAIQTSMAKLGPGIVLAGLTAALSFFPLVFSGFKGLAELGLITSMGMLMTTVTTLGLLPALALLFDRSRARGRVAPAGGQIRPLLRLSRTRAFAFLVAAVVLFAGSLWAAGKVSFDLNMLRLQSRNAESVIWEKKLLADSQRSSMYGVILARTLEEVKKKTRALKALPTVSEVDSIESLLPEDQQEKIAFLRRMKPLIAGVGSFLRPEDPIDLKELENILGRIRFKMLDSSESDWGASKPLESQMVQVRQLIDELRLRFHAMRGSRLVRSLSAFGNALLGDLDDKLDILRSNINTRPMRPADLPECLLRRFIGEKHLYLLMVFPTQNIWEPELLGRFVHDLRSVDPDAIGDAVTLYTFTNTFRNACIRAAIYAVVLIFVVVFLSFRNIGYTALVMLPLVVGTAWTMGLMHLFGVDLNLANSIFLPLVVGAGVEYGIIIVQRWRQLSGAGEVVLPISTAKGVILAGLTTTVGFGSLAISHHQGIHSLGILAMVGSLSILGAAVLVLPAVLRIMEKGRPHPEAGFQHGGGGDNPSAHRAEKRNFCS